MDDVPRPGAGEHPWTGPYDAMARYLAPAAATTVDAMVGRGLRAGGAPLLDVGTGSGNVLRRARARGVGVIGIDRSSSQLARARAEGAGAPGPSPGALVRADAESVPIGDGRAGAACSVFGVIFAARPASAVAEMVRCVEGGGIVALTAWTPGGWPTACRRALGGVLRREPAPFPVALGESARQRSLLTSAGLTDIDVQHHHLDWWFDDVDHAIDVLSREVGGLRPLRSDLEAAGRWDEGRVALREALAGRLRPRPDRRGLVLEEPYLLALGTRR